MKYLKICSLVLLITLLFVSLSIGKERTYGSICIRSKNIISVYDGDTFWINIPKYPPIVGTRISVRVYGIDTPEIRGSSEREKVLALQAKDFVTKKLSEAKKIELRNLRRDKYFRLLAEVYIDGNSLAEMLIKEGLGRAYFGDTKLKW